MQLEQTSAWPRADAEDGEPFLRGALERDDEQMTPPAEMTDPEIEPDSWLPADENLGDAHREGLSHRRRGSKRGARPAGRRSNPQGTRFGRRATFWKVASVSRCGISSSSY